MSHELYFYDDIKYSIQRDVTNQSRVARPLFPFSQHGAYRF